MKFSCPQDDLLLLSGDVPLLVIMDYGGVVC